MSDGHGATLRVTVTVAHAAAAESFAKRALDRQCE